MRKTSRPHDLGILFLHHKTDAVTQQNLDSFRRWNPAVPIIPISGGERLPGGYAPEDMPEFQRLLVKYARTDWMYRSGLDVLIFDWYRQRQVEADRWILVEWDAWCGMPVREWLQEVWHADVSVASVRWPNREPEWYWFRHIARLPARYRPFAVGMVPTCFATFSDRAFRAISERLVGDILGHIIYEVRMPTLAHEAGFAPVVNPRAGWNVTWQEVPEQTPLSRNLWHAVKGPVTAERICPSFGEEPMIPAITPPKKVLIPSAGAPALVATNGSAD
jgi:hypothetical protein